MRGDDAHARAVHVEVDVERAAALVARHAQIDAAHRQHLVAGQQAVAVLAARRRRGPAPRRSRSRSLRPGSAADRRPGGRGSGSRPPAARRRRPRAPRSPWRRAAGSWRPSRPMQRWTLYDATVSVFVRTHLAHLRRYARFRSPGDSDKLRRTRTVAESLEKQEQMNEVVDRRSGAQPDRAPQRRAVGPASGRSARRRPARRGRAQHGRSRPPSVRSSAAACRRSASSRSTSPAPRGSHRACRWRCAATTVDSQCGSSQQATSLAAGLIGAGIEDLVLACGVEMMTRVPLGANMKGGSPLPKSYARALRLRVAVPGRRDDRASEYGITREDTDRFGLRSQTLAIRPGRKARFDREVVPIEAPELDAEGKPTGATQDGGARRGPARDLDGEARRAEARRAGRRAHRRHVLAGVGRRRRACCSPRRSAPRARPQAARPHRHDDAGRRRSGHDAEGPDPGDAQGAEGGRPLDRRHRRIRSQRGIRVRRPRVDEGAAAPTRSGSTPTAAPSRSAIRPAAPARA